MANATTGIASAFGVGESRWLEVPFPSPRDEELGEPHAAQIQPFPRHLATENDANGICGQTDSAFGQHGINTPTHLQPLLHRGARI